MPSKLEAAREVVGDPTLDAVEEFLLRPRPAVLVPSILVPFGALLVGSLADLGWLSLFGWVSSLAVILARPVLDLAVGRHPGQGRGRLVDRHRSTGRRVGPEQQFLSGTGVVTHPACS